AHDQEVQVLVGRRDGGDERGVREGPAEEHRDLGGDRDAGGFEHHEHEHGLVAVLEDEISDEVLHLASRKPTETINGRRTGRGREHSDSVKCCEARLTAYRTVIAGTPSRPSPAKDL